MSETKITLGNIPLKLPPEVMQSLPDMASKVGGLVSRLKVTDLSPMIQMLNQGGMFQNLLPPILSELTGEMKEAVDEILSVSQGSKLYIQFLDSPTPPLVIEVGATPSITIMGKEGIEEKKIPGVELYLETLLPLVKDLAANASINLPQVMGWVEEDKIEVKRMAKLLKIIAPVMKVPYLELQQAMSNLVGRLIPLLQLLGSP
jgi:hypothetical protein